MPSPLSVYTALNNSFVDWGDNVNPESRDVRSMLGPPVIVFWQSCLAEEPKLYTFAWTSAIIVFVIVTILTCCHCVELAGAPISLQRTYYFRMAAIPIVFATASLISVLAPRTTLLLEILMIQYEAFAVATLATIHFMLLAKRGMEAGATMQSLQAMSVALADMGKKKFFGVPPLGCCFRPCMKPHGLTAGQLVFVDWIIWQYTLVSPCAVIVFLWLKLALPDEYGDPFSQACIWVNKFSGLVAIYGLMILNLATSEYLSKWHMHRKFWAFKILIILGILQDIAIERFAEWYLEGHESCLAWEGRKGQGTHLADFWASWLRLVECILISLLMRRAFPGSEILCSREMPAAISYAQLDLQELAGKEQRAFDSASEEESGTDCHDGTV
eukprot:TRINITY_DN15544_c0_g4_i1.p1 TRINITY_DN15544_c0_g4~~TRINITY_DN15544_c0_g4_i1.p1  ORF type:complete len:386 (+),score=23.75 TRINITY_DN15544_c0_g4_i1:46-1203(+)